MFKRKRWFTLSILMVILTAMVVLTSGCVVPTSSAQALSDDESAARTLQVRGRGTVSAQPDVATAHLGVQTEAETANEALSQNNEKTQSLITALEEAGVAAENIQTQSVQLRPRYEEPQPESGTREVSGYVARNIAEVRVEDLKALGTILDSAVQAGGNRVEGIQFEISDTAELQDQARQAAWQDARHKAEQLAALANAELGAAIRINESSNQPRPVVREEMVMERAAAVPIEPGMQSLEVQVNVEWEIQ